MDKMTILLTGEAAKVPQPFIKRLRDGNCEDAVSPSDDELQRLLMGNKADAVIGHEHDLDRFYGIIKDFPMTNYALISKQEAAPFHEMTEGYGILMQLPVSPTEEDADSLLTKLERLCSFAPKKTEGEKR